MSYVFKYAGRFPGGQLLVSGNPGRPPVAPFKIKVHDHTYTVTSIAADGTQATTPNVFRLQLQGINSEVDVNSLQLSDKEEIPVLVS
jgi:LEA14-like dessication related protein